MHPDFSDEGDVPKAWKIAKGLPESDAVVAGIGVRELWEFTVVPVKVAGVDDYPADGGAVAANVLGCRGHDYIHTVLDGFDQSYAHRVVDDEGNACFVGDLCDGLEVGYIQFGVADCFGVDGSRLIRDRFLEGFGLCGVYELRRSAEFGEGVVQ